jgi:hypothetical protein
MEPEALASWRAHRLPSITADAWDPWAAKAGLAEIRRLRAQLDAAQVVLVAVVAAAAGRDTRATLVRHGGMSTREAREAERVAAVVSRVPGAGAALAGAAVSAGHLALLAPVTDAATAADLLAVATRQPVDLFATTVHRHRVGEHAASVRDRQRNGRSVSFFRADDGNVGMRAILTPLDGERITAAINERCDANWRAEHPDRAQVLGGHDAEPRERRLADAFVELMLSPGATTPPPAGSDTRPASRIGVVVVVEEATMTAHLAGPGTPLGADDLADAVDAARTDLYVALRSTTGSILHFGRSRRYATAIQKLALVTRDGGRCCWPGCDEPWTRCDIDHITDWDHGGPTDLPNLQLLCRRHHAHRHETATTPDTPDPPLPGASVPAAGVTACSGRPPPRRAPA